MAFSWTNTIASGAKITNAAMAELVNNSSLLETYMGIPSGSKFSWPDGQNPFSQTGQKIFASEMSNLKTAIDMIDTYNNGSSCKGYCSSINTSFCSGVNSTNKSHNAGYNSNLDSYLATHYNSYNGSLLSSELSSKNATVNSYDGYCSSLNSSVNGGN